MGLHITQLDPGCEQYLPFARSRIKAIKATGLVHGIQKFEIDGRSIHVRVENGQDFISITGDVVELAMDSGIVVVGTIGPGAPTTWLAGELFEAGPAVAYNAGFVETGDAGVRTNPSKGSQGQLSGKITKGVRFTGAIDKQQAFRPADIPVDPPTDPPTTVPDPGDGSLFAKKYVGVLCPASIFTGRCRLYVQAMYGLPLYERDKKGVVVKVNQPLKIVSETTAAPALMIPAYKHKTDTVEYADMMLDTNCGVWLDPESGKHWLVRPTSGQFRVFPLISTKAGEAMRKHLVPSTGKNALDEEDREHLEAYILAHSLPDVKNMQIAAGGFGFTSYSMGYGWHWNWDGKVADIVINNMFPQGGTTEDGDGRNYAMRSTHYRVTLKMKKTPDEEIRQSWEAAVTTVEAEKDWAVYRVFWTITEPNYADFTQDKTTPQHSLQFECDAPFYAFYIRNELKVCRVNVTWCPPGVGVRTMTPGMAGSSVYHAGDVTYSTLGERGGFFEEKANGGSSFFATFSCGRTETPPLYAALTDGGIRTVIGPKSLISESKVWSATTYGTFTENEGYPPYGTTTFTSDYSEAWGALYSYSWRNVVKHTTETSLATVIVPFYDSEAVYIQASTQLVTRDVGQDIVFNDPYVSFGHRMSTHWSNSYTGASGVVIRYTYGETGVASGAIAVSNTTVDETTIEPTSMTVLISRAGVQNATFSHLNVFHSNSEGQVGVMYETLSGTSTSAPIVIAPGFIDPVGNGEAGGGAQVLVGWV